MPALYIGCAPGWRRKDRLGEVIAFVPDEISAPPGVDRIGPRSRFPESAAVFLFSLGEGANWGTWGFDLIVFCFLCGGGTVIGATVSCFVLSLSLDREDW